MIKSINPIRFLTRSQVYSGIYSLAVLVAIIATSTINANAQSTSSAIPEKSVFSGPVFSGEASFELQIEQGFDSDDTVNERANSFGTIEFAPAIQLSENFLIDGTVIIEPVQETTSGDDTTFDDEGVFIEELKLNYQGNAWSAYAGKFNPGFGVAWDLGGGIWGGDFAEDYELAEKIGFGGAYTLATQGMRNHTLTASTFFTDTSTLSQSAGTGRGRTRKSDGGVGNTQDLSSFSVAMDGKNIGTIANLNYHLGLRHLAAGNADKGKNDEKGIAASVSYILPTTGPVKTYILLETVHLENVNGDKDDTDYNTVSAQMILYENWSLTLSHTGRKTDIKTGIPSAVALKDHLTQISAGYAFANGVSVDAGWKTTEEANIDTDTFGLLANYAIKF